MSRSLALVVEPGELAVCRLAPQAAVPPWVPVAGFVSVTRTVDELSIVCDASAGPRPPAGDPSVERGWRRLRFEGPFAFTETGVLLAVLEPLDGVGVGVFALSTFDTDHVLVPGEALDRAVAALRGAGHTVVG